MGFTSGHCSTKIRDPKFCVGYRKITTKMLPDAFSFSTIQEILLSLAEAAVFTDLDLYSGSALVLDDKSLALGMEFVYCTGIMVDVVGDLCLFQDDVRNKSGFSVEFCLLEERKLVTNVSLFLLDAPSDSTLFPEMTHFKDELSSQVKFGDKAGGRNEEAEYAVAIQ